MTAARRRTLAVAIGAVVAIALVVRRHVRGSMGKRVPGGILVADPGLYDTIGHRLVLRPLLRGIARDVAATVPAGAKVLDVGCGPGLVSILLARRGLDVTGLDLDPEIIERARANATAIPSEAHERTPSFLAGDVAAMSFPDGTFDIVVSTLSMHHWDDPTAGLGEIARVLRPGGRVLIWDFRRGRIPLHGSLPDPASLAVEGALRVERSNPWRWPWRVGLLQRVELSHSSS